MYEFFKLIFYAFGITAITYEVWKVKNYDVLTSMRETAIKATKEKQSLKDFESAGFCLFVICQILYFGWAAVGLFSSQWLMFLILLVMSFLEKFWRTEEGNFIDSIASIGLILFAILNTYHFHI